MGLFFSNSTLRNRAIALVLAVLLSSAVTGCGLLRVEASGSNDHIDWSVGVPF